MNNFSFEPLKLKLATNNIIIPMEDGVADLTNAETSAKIMLAGKELFPIFDERIGGRNLLLNSNFKTDSYNGWSTVYGTQQITQNGYLKTYTSVSASARIEKGFTLSEIGTFTFSVKVKTNVAIIWQIWEGLSIQDRKVKLIEDDFEIHSITFTNADAGSKIIRGYQSNAPIGANTLIEWEKLERGAIPTPWTPAPEEVLQNATLTFYNCSAAIVGDLIKITSHKPDTTRGWVDVTVNYGNLSNTKRLNWSVEGVEPYKPLGTLLTMNNKGIKL